MGNTFLINQTPPCWPPLKYSEPWLRLSRAGKFVAFVLIELLSPLHGTTTVNIMGLPMNLLHHIHLPKTVWLSVRSKLQWTTYALCYETQTSAIPIGLRLQHIPFTLETLFHLVVTLTVSLLSRSHENGRGLPIFGSLGRSVGLKFLLLLEDQSLTHAVLNAAFWGTRPGVVTTKSKILPHAVSLFHVMSFLRRADLVGHQQVWGSRYRSSKRI
jgi:hypothetical protein